jgi:hypothetical protein
MVVASPRRATLAELARNGSPRLGRTGKVAQDTITAAGAWRIREARILDRQKADVKPQFVTYDGAAAREGCGGCDRGGDVQRVSGNMGLPSGVSPVVEVPL